MSACRSACHRNNFARAGRVGNDAREDVLVGVGVVQFQLYGAPEQRRDAHVGAPYKFHVELYNGGEMRSAPEM